MCAEESYSQSIQTKFTGPADFKRLTARCGFLTERSNKERLIFCVACMCRSPSLQTQKCSHSRGQRGAATTAVD